MNSIIPNSMKIIVVGHARHGKDTICDMIAEHGLPWQSSSMIAAETVVMPYMETKLGITYPSVEVAFEDRHQHRNHWFDAISAYNAPDRTKLARDIFGRVDVYAGMRNHKELWACKNAGLVDHVIWVDRSEHRPHEPRTSMTIEPWMADYHIDNNGDLDQTQFNVNQLMKQLAKTAPYNHERAMDTICS